MTDPSTLMAHRRPLLLLDEILEERPNGVAASLRVDPHAWYAGPGGEMPAWFGLELMAQTIAAFGGLQKRARHQDPRLGYFLGTREYRCATPSFPAGAALRIEVTLRYLDDSGISAFDCRIHLDGAEVASATLKTFEEP